MFTVLRQDPVGGLQVKNLGGKCKTPMAGPESISVVADNFHGQGLTRPIFREHS